MIPDHGTLGGTVRMLDSVAWTDMERRIRQHVGEIVAPYGVHADVDYKRGVPPVVNDPASVALLSRVVEHVLGPDGRAPTAQSLGGEDFAWFLTQVPGAMGRVGTRTPGGPTYDIHQGNLRVDERATGIAAKVLASVAVQSLAPLAVLDRLGSRWRWCIEQRFRELTPEVVLNESGRVSNDGFNFFFQPRLVAACENETRNESGRASGRFTQWHS